MTGRTPERSLSELVAIDKASSSDVFHNGQIILAGFAAEYSVFHRFLPCPVQGAGLVSRSETTFQKRATS